MRAAAGKVAGMIGSGAGARLLMLHKPRGVIVTTRDERGRRTVYDVLPARARTDGWLAVGRLDRDSRGLLLFTRDPSLIDPLTRPGRCVKRYEVVVRGHVTAEHIAAAAAGIASPAGLLRAQVAVCGTLGPKTRLLVELDEGKNRHIRRLFGALRDPLRDTPLKVLELKRIAFGPLTLDIPSGQWRLLTAHEEEQLTGTLATTGK